MAISTHKIYELQSVVYDFYSTKMESVSVLMVTVIIIIVVVVIIIIINY